MFKGEFPLLRIISSIANFLFLYKLLKKFKEIRFTISITRVQSRFAGFVCSRYVPRCIRKPFFGSFSYVYGVKIEEAVRDRYDQYTTFTDFFTRTLKPGVRTIEAENDLNSISSPCDGRILTIGKINSVDSTIDCVKGRSYRLDEFMLGYIGDSKDPTEPTLKIEACKNNAGV